MQYSHESDPILNFQIENEITADRQHSESRMQIRAKRTQSRMPCQNLELSVELQQQTLSR